MEYFAVGNFIYQFFIFAPLTCAFVTIVARRVFECPTPDFQLHHCSYVVTRYTTDN